MTKRCSSQVTVTIPTDLYTFLKQESEKKGITPDALMQELVVIGLKRIETRDLINEVFENRLEVRCVLDRMRVIDTNLQELKSAIAVVFSDILLPLSELSPEEVRQYIDAIFYGNEEVHADVQADTKVQCAIYKDSQ